MSPIVLLLKLIGSPMENLIKSSIKSFIELLSTSPIEWESDWEYYPQCHLECYQEWESRVSWESCWKYYGLNPIGSPDAWAFEVSFTAYWSLLRILMKVNPIKTSHWMNSSTPIKVSLRILLRISIGRESYWESYRERVIIKNHIGWVLLRFPLIE